MKKLFVLVFTFIVALMIGGCGADQLQAIDEASPGATSTERIGNPVSTPEPSVTPIATQVQPPTATLAETLYAIEYGPGGLPLCIENILGYPMSIGATGFVAELMDFLGPQPAIKWLNGIEKTVSFPFEVEHLKDGSAVTYCENE